MPPLALVAHTSSVVPHAHAPPQAARIPDVCEAVCPWHKVPYGQQLTDKHARIVLALAGVTDAVRQLAAAGRGWRRRAAGGGRWRRRIRRRRCTEGGKSAGEERIELEKGEGGERRC